MVLDEHSDLDVLWHDGMIIFEIGTLSYMEVQAAVVACSALLLVAAEAWGVFGFGAPTKMQKESTSVIVTQEMG